MKVFMLGWEFPPHISGGLGTACFGMTKGLDEIGVEVTFVLPTSLPVDATSHVQLRSPITAARRRVTRGTRVEEPWEQIVERSFEHLDIRQVPAVLQPYGTPVSYAEAIRRIRTEQEKIRRVEVTEGETEVEFEEPADQELPELPSGTFVAGSGANYTGDLMGQVQRYARLAMEIATGESFDVVHAHDWMTYPAALAVKAATGKPLVVHIHSTEFDRSGSNVNQHIYDIERMGMHGADRVVCVSRLTADIVERRYGVEAAKIEVVYNAVELPDERMATEPIRHNEKIVLFLGRVTMQKGPEYFLQAAKKVVGKFKNVRFVMAGSGDMINRCIEEAASLGIGRYVTFTGFLRGDDVDRVFRMADLYVMPSVSEPFGISPLEALSRNVPVIISKQSGVSEVLTHALKVDFWDIDEMADKILAVLRRPPLQSTLRQHGAIDLRKLSWTDSAARLRDIYASLIGQG